MDKISIKHIKIDDNICIKKISMSIQEYNPNTHYLKINTYTTKSGEVHRSYYISPKNITYKKVGRPKNMPDITNPLKIKELRDAGLSWNKIAKKFNISAYHAKQIYNLL